MNSIQSVSNWYIVEETLTHDRYIYYTNPNSFLINNEGNVTDFEKQVRYYPNHETLQFGIFRIDNDSSGDNSKWYPIAIIPLSDMDNPLDQALDLATKYFQ